MCLILAGSVAEIADSDTAGLRWGLRSNLSYKMLILLVQGPLSEFCGGQLSPFPGVTQEAKRNRRVKYLGKISYCEKFE